MEYGVIQLAKEGNIAIITLNRPPMNPLNSQVYRELSHAADALQIDETVKVVVITGAGEKAFAAGSDVTEMTNMGPLDVYAFCHLCMSTLAKIENLHKPVIAAINGFALGGGLELALTCDFRLATEKSTLGLPEINLGIIPGTGGSQRLARLGGANKAKEVIFFGDNIDAASAEKMGLVNRVVSSETFMEDVLKFAKKLASKSSVPMKMAKEVINTGMNIDISSALKLEIQNVVTVFASEDGQEGMRAFMEKRKPNFVGK
jgi:enoyl-CoA hydratase